MISDFPSVLTALRKERGISQKQAAKGLHVSQALLSHYENGVREPKFDFIDKACLYYGVSADYILGRSNESSVMINCVSPYAVDVAEKTSKTISAIEATNNKEFIKEASQYLEIALEEITLALDGSTPNGLERIKKEVLLEKMAVSSQNKTDSLITALYDASSIVLRSQGGKTID